MYSIYCPLSPQNISLFFKVFIYLAAVLFICQALVVVHRIFFGCIMQDYSVRHVGSINSSLTRNQTWGSLHWEDGVLALDSVKKQAFDSVGTQVHCHVDL